MSQHDLIRLLVLVEISDDYEEPEHVYENVAKRARLCGMVIQFVDVRTALMELVGSGLAKAYRLSTTAQAMEIQGFPPVDQVHEYYFWITEKGKGIVDSTRGDSWPFDDEGDLRPDWSPPSGTAGA